MDAFRRTVVVLVLAASSGLACRGGGAGRVCPEGMTLVGAKSVAGKSAWCRSADGKLARWIEFYDEKNRRQSCGYSGGKPEGSFLAWHPGGKPWIEGEYRQGLKAGHWIQRDKEGLKVAEGEYREGTFVAGAPVANPALCEKMTPP